MTTTESFDARVLVADGVHVVRWPEQDDWRRTLQRAEVPTILLVAASTAPPQWWDDLEDWVRLPLDPAELQARARTLGRRARHRIRPFVDLQGMCWVGDRWIDLSPCQAAITSLLVERFGEVVPLADVDAGLERAGASVAISARKAMVVRLRRRLAEIGLALHSVRDRGYVVDWRDPDGATRASSRSDSA